MMKRQTHLTIPCVLFVLLIGGPSWGQAILPELAGLSPLTGNIDLSPGFLPSDGGGTRDVDMDYIGDDPVTGNDEFAYMAFLDTQICTDRRLVFSQDGIVYGSDGYLDDQGNEFMAAWANEFFTNFTTALTLGTFFGSLQGDESTGDYIVTSTAGDLGVAGTAGESWIDRVVNTNGGTLNGAAYYTGVPNNTTIFQRFNRDGGLVTPLTAGRNVPAGDINDGINWSLIGRYRPGGAAILSNGNSVYVIDDQGGTGAIGPRNHFFGNGSSGSLQLYTIGTPAGAFVGSTSPVYSLALASSFDSPNGTAASQNGWWATGVTRLAVFRNDGTKFFTDASVPATYNGTNASLFPLGGGTFAVDDDETRIGCGPDTIYIPGQYTTPSGAKLAAIVRYAVNSVAGTVTPLPILTPMDDLTVEPIAFASRFHTSVDVNANGDIAVVYRHPDNGGVLARLYNPDGTPRTGSFYVPEQGENDDLEELVGLTGVTNILFRGDLGNNAGKAAHIDIAMGSNTIGVMWLTSSGVPSADITALDCHGVAKALPLSHAARVISLTPPAEPASVENWDLLN